MYLKQKPEKPHYQRSNSTSSRVMLVGLCLRASSHNTANQTRFLRNLTTAVAKTTLRSKTSLRIASKYPNTYTVQELARGPVFFRTKSGVLEKSSTVSIFKRKFVALMVSGFRRNCYRGATGARACSQAQ